LSLPSRLIFWRSALAVTGTLAFLSTWQMLNEAARLGIQVTASKSWLALIGLLGLLALLAFCGMLLTWLPHLQNWARFAHRALPAWLRWLAVPLLAACVLIDPLQFTPPAIHQIIAKSEFVRLLIFWLLALSGSFALRIVWEKANPGATLAITLLTQASAHLIFSYLTEITAYPFALGWSETSRFYYPSLFLAQKLYGQPLAWPILHPSLHLVLTAPYWLDAPLWAHRAWQILLRFILVGGIAPAFLTRLKISPRPLQFAAGVWIFLTLFDLPLYLHLAPPVILILWGYSAQDKRRTWAALILASLWAGLSRLNWYPVPGMLAAALYLLETPYQNKGWRYLLRPALWVLGGTLIAFLAMRSYIALSGISQAGDFYTSLRSALLWYRLWPNATYPLGVLPGILIYSLPMWGVLALILRRCNLHPLRVGLLLAGLAVLFVGGIFVSMKIGGGGDLHNMDAYAVSLIIVAASLFFGRVAPENGQISAAERITLQPVPIPWVLTALLVLTPVWFALRVPAGWVSYDQAASRATLTALQRRVDQVNAGAGEILFITQRHLIAMKMLHSVNLIPEYEREELMEMAMAGDEGYLDQFKAEVRALRFAAIVVDPLAINFLGNEYAMGEENNAWVRFVAKPILCNYRPAEVFEADHIVIYVPQQGTAACP
jgi:hypothetical protein